MNSPMRVHNFTLTSGTETSEHIYADALGRSLANRGIHFVDRWRDADIVHLFEVNCLTADSLRSFRYPTLVRILHSDTPVVVSTDDLYFVNEPDLTVHPRLYSLNHYIQRQLFERTDAIIALSRSVKQNLEPEVSNPPIHVVQHGVKEAYFDDYTPTDDPFVLHVSLAAPRKNPEAVVEAASNLDCRFVLAGSGWDERLPDECPNVETTGYLSEEDLIELYHRAPVFYFPTLHEGFGLPVLEAMASGTAVVTSDAYSVPEVTGDAAILCDPEDVKAHISALEELLSDQTRRQKLAQLARDRASDFTWEETARKTYEVYQTVID